MSGTIRTIAQLLTEFAGGVPASITAADEQDFIATMQFLTGSTLIPNIQTSTNYNFAFVDVAQCVLMNSTIANTITIPANSLVAFPVNQVLTFGQIGTGQTTILAGSVAVTLHTASSLSLRAQYSTGSAWQYAANTWLISGDET
jgi:hypothetical protein